MAIITRVGLLGPCAAYLGFAPKNTAELPPDARADDYVIARAFVTTVYAQPIVTTVQST